MDVIGADGDGISPMLNGIQSQLTNLELQDDVNMNSKQQLNDH